MRRAANLDGNHKQVVLALQAIGASVQSLASMGGGVPDLAVGLNNFNVFLEIKNSSKRPSARKLTEAEKRWHASWAGQVAVVTTPEEAQLVVIQHCIGNKK